MSVNLTSGPLRTKPDTGVVLSDKKKKEKRKKKKKKKNVAGKSVALTADAHTYDKGYKKWENFDLVCFFMFALAI